MTHWNNRNELTSSGVPTFQGWNQLLNNSTWFNTVFSIYGYLFLTSDLESLVTWAFAYTSVADVGLGLQPINSGYICLQAAETWIISLHMVHWIIVTRGFNTTGSPFQIGLVGLDWRGSRQPNRITLFHIRVQQVVVMGFHL